MRKAVYPGSFDPVTYNHLDVIRRSSSLVDELIVGVLNNNTKTPLFSVEERVKILGSDKDLPNVQIESFSGLSVEFAKQSGAQFIVRGLRAITDFDYELQMAQTNRVLNPTSTPFSDHQSGICLFKLLYSKKKASYGGDISKLVPGAVVDRIYNKIWKKHK